MPNRSFSISLLFFSLAIAVSAPVFPHAAQPNANELQELNRFQERQQQQQEERRRSQEEELRSRGEAPPSSSETPIFPQLPEEPGALCMEVQSIPVAGYTVYSDQKIRSIVSGYEEKCLTLVDINNLLRKITNLYLEDGYLTSRAFADPTQEKPGVLRIMVIEGKVEDIIFNEGDRNMYYRGYMSFPSIKNKVLNLRDIEQGIDQMNRLPSGNASIELLPGESVGGTKVMVRDAPSKTWRVGLGLDNHGQRSTGQYQYSASIEKDNFFGLGDQTVFYWAEDAPFLESPMHKGRQQGHNHSAAGYFSLPIGYWTLSANISAYSYDTLIRGAAQDFTFRGNSHVLSAGLDRVIHRDTVSKTSLFDNLGASAEVSRAIYDQSYLHIGMSDSLQGYNSDGSFNLVNKSNARGYRTDKHAYSKVKAYTAQQQALYGIPAAPRDHLQEWKTVYREEVVGGVKGATLMAGMDMLIDAGNVANKLGTISAGRNLSINADILNNVGLDLYSTTEIFRHFFSMGKHNEWEGSHTQIWNSSSIYQSIPALLTAGQTLRINVTEGYDNSGRENADYIGVYSGSPAYRGLGIIGIGLNNPLAAGSNVVDLQTSTKIGQNSGNFVPNVSLGGLFSLSSNPNHPYLVESNPALTSIGSFYGSDYFLSKIGYDLATEQRRLFGDSFFESRLVREQLLAQTGQRYLFEGVTDDAETMRLLMDNALDAGKSLGLYVGVSLTPEQIGNLSKDIIWLEEIEYEGQRVLAPRLYLCEATRAELSVRGGAVTADTVIIEGNGIKNSGLIRGNQVQLTSLTDILNRGGEITGKDTLFVNSKGSIINQSGVLGGGNLDLFAANDIRMETVSRQNTRSGKHMDTTLHQAAEVRATGDVSMQAGNDIVFQGAKSNIDGAAVLVAGNDLKLLSTSAAERYEARNILERREGNLGSGLSAGEVHIQAGRDILLAGSAINSDGNASLRAGGNITAEAVTNEQESYFHISRGSSYTNTRHSESTQSQGSAITAGGNLLMTAGANPDRGPGNVAFAGSSASAQGNVDIQASGDVILANVNDSSYNFHSRSSKKTFSVSSSAKESRSTTSVGSSVAGNNVTITAGDNVLIAASNAHADATLNISAERGDIIAMAAQNSVYAKTREKKKKLTGIGGALGLSSIVMPGLLENLAPVASSAGLEVDLIKYSAKNTESLGLISVGSFLTAGNDISMSAGRDIGIIGSAVAADNDITMAAGRDVNLVPGREGFFSKSTETKGSLGFSVPGLSINGATIFVGLKETKSGIALSGDYTSGSLVNAGNDANITAGRDVNQVSSHIAAGRDVSVDAGRDWIAAAAHDVENLHQWVKEIAVGLTVSVRQNVTSAVKTVIDLPQDATAGRGGAGYSAATATGAGLRAAHSVEGAASETVSASATVGAKFSEVQYSANSATAVPSSVSAGRDVLGLAGRDIAIEGGRINAGRDVLLDAGRDVTIAAATNTADSDLSSSGGGGAVGVKAAYGSGGLAFGVNVAANAYGSSGVTDSNQHTNAVVTAGDVLFITSGRDTTVKGAHLEAGSVWMDVGRNLTVESLQDSYDSKNSSWSAGIDLTVGYGFHINANLGIGGGASSSSWVGQQTSIVGRNGVDIYTGENTHIKGGLIYADNGNLILNTNTLSYEAVRDKNKGSSWDVSVSGGKSFGGGFEQGADSDRIKPFDYTTGKSGTGTYAPPVLAAGYEAHDSRQINRPTVGPGEIIVRSDPGASLDGLNRTLESARESTRSEKDYVDVFLPFGLIQSLIEGTAFSSYKEDAKKYGFTPNLLPGFFAVPSLTGQAEYKMTEKLEFDRNDDENRIPVPNSPSPLMSENNPFLQALFHLLPGTKSFSEIHDVQMIQYEKAHNNEEAPSLYTVLTIPESFTRSLIGALQSTLDIANWGDNWATIKKSYQLRKEQPQDKRP